MHAPCAKALLERSMCGTECPLRIKLGHCSDVRSMAALPPQTEVHPRYRYVAEGPLLTHAPQQTTCTACNDLLDHLIGAASRFGGTVRRGRSDSLPPASSGYRFVFTSSSPLGEFLLQN